MQDLEVEAVTTEEHLWPEETARTLRSLILLVVDSRTSAAEAVLDWAGLGQLPLDMTAVIAQRHSMSASTLHMLLREIRQAGSRMEHDFDLLNEMRRPSGPDEDDELRARQAHLLGVAIRGSLWDR